MIEPMRQHGQLGHHPVMAVSTATLGSLALEVTHHALTASFITADGVIEDTFAITKLVEYEVTRPPPERCEKHLQ